MAYDDNWSETAHWTLRTIVSVLVAGLVAIVLITGLVTYNTKVQNQKSEYRIACVHSGSQYVSGNCIKVGNHG